ncbi:histone-lysine N-methyltransferase, H3 lysine-9 specific SUVH1-like [Dorcoceras hygrometricum]|nr:histone-lysine N-methyltransferase, H3 lysine-9 specific SUVH1-like [Dorcoceras hygrometricum]
MDQDLGSKSNPFPDSADKSKILHVKPLRCLVPVFPNPPGMSSVTTPQPSPFVCVPPSGPFPSGVRPFYPFLASNHSEQATFGVSGQPGNFGFGSNIPAPIPLNSFRTPTPKANGDAAPGKRDLRQFTNAEYVDTGKGKSQSRKRGAGKGDGIGLDSLVNSIFTSCKLTEFDDFKRSNGDKDTVETILLAFDLLRRKLTQLEESKDLAIGVTRRPDLKVANLLMSKGVRTNTGKRIGHVPGVEVGDIFFFRMELCVVGLHTPSMAGIDYMSVKITATEEPVAKNRGWGLRSWDAIRAGGYICEYAGEIIQKPSSSDFNDNHIFFATRYNEPLEAVSDDPANSTKSPFPLVISAKNSGNVARFMNHSCSPNVFWKPVLRESNGDLFLHIAFFAIRHIPPMQELTYNYGMFTPEKGDHQGRKKCLCGSVKCKGYLY